MNFLIERSHLMDALNKAVQGLSGRQTLPILSHVLIAAKGDSVVFTSTDLDTSIRYKVPAAVREDGTLAVPAHRLKDYVAKLADGPIRFNAEDGLVTVRAGRSEMQLVSLPMEDFPVLPVVSGQLFKVHAAQLKESLRLTTFAASKEESRSLLMGVLFEARGNVLTLVATDTHRLAWKQIKTPIDAADFNSIIPAGAVEKFRRFIPYRTSDMSVLVNMDKSAASFTFDNLTLTCRIMDGRFPNYEKIVPDSFIQTLSVDAVEFAGLVDRTFIIARECSNKVVFDVKPDSMRATTGNKHSGTVTEEMDVKGCVEPLSVAWNVKYFGELLHQLKPLKSQTVQIAINGPLKVGIITLEGRQDFKYILMPMQV